ncbi:MAG: hypothetical protein LBL47_05080 [Lactobacillus sp.]|nr:hypothetical protein [Lactobacillus sp.]
MGLFSGLFTKKRKYDHIVSLGNNCEFSFQFFTNYKFVDANLFSWTYIMDRDKFLGCLEDIDGLLSEGLEDPVPLYECKKYNVRYHGRAKWEDLMNLDGELNREAVDEDKKEIYSRVEHLKEKFKKMLVDDKSKLFVLKDPKDTDFVIAVKLILDKIVKGRYDLLVVVTKDEFDKFKLLQADNIFVRAINNYSPETAVTSKKQSDMNGWKKIFSEFAPKLVKSKNKKFKFEEV